MKGESDRMKKEEIGFGGKILISHIRKLKEEEIELRKKIIPIKNNRRKTIKKIRRDFNAKILPLENKANGLMHERLKLLRKYGFYADFIPKLILTEKQLKKDVEESHSLREIAKKYNVSMGCIHNWLSKFGYRSFQSDYRDYIENP